MDSQNQHSAGDSTALPPGQCEGTPSNPGRRRFARVGAGASGIILTLASEPGMATTMCKSPSGSLSGSLKSQPGNQTVVCGGLSCTWWRDNPGQWPRGCVPDSTKSVWGTGTQATTFASLFPYGTTDLLRNGTCMEVLNNINIDASKDPDFVGAHMVAAYLNCKSGKISFLTPTKVQGMWHDLVLYGHYAPTAGLKWGRQEITTYLNGTEGP